MYMTIKAGKLYLRPRDIKNLYPNWSINVFFESLALDRGNKGIAVVLSGAGSDGTHGITYIKNAGGMVIAQNPESCEYNSMPNNAIRTGLVDYILLPYQMPEIILNYVAHI